MNLESEKKKEIRGRVGASHLFSSLIRDPKAPEFKTKSRADLVYIVFPLIIAMLTLFIPGGKLSYSWVAFFLPILVTSSIMGKNAGLIMSTICIGVLFFYDRFFPSGVFVIQLSGEEPKFIAACIMYLISWFIGGLSDMEAQQRRGELNSRLSLEGLVNAVERKRAEEEMSLSGERFLKAYSASPNLMLIIGCSDHRVIDINKGFLNVTGRIRQEVVGRTVAELNLWTDLMAYSKAVMAIQEQEVIHNFEIKFNKKDGQWGIGLLSADTINLGGEKCILFVMNDISQRKKAEERLTYLSMHDSLTGLYNRAYFEEEMRRLEEGRHSSVGMIICDVDGLKLINDTFGHSTGDGLLVAAAGVIKNPFRTGDMVSRIGGDEFAVLLPDCDRQQVESACRRIAFNVKRYNEKHPELPLSISMGFAVRKGTSVSMLDLFKEADDNMSREKLHRSRSARSAIVQALMKTLEARDFITENHSKRLQGLVTNLARAAGLPDYKLSDLRLLARFHDIGKIGLADRILFKPGPLTAGEVLEMQRHCEIGSRIAQSVPDLLPIADWVLKHHEWWNGQGYPLQLKGEEIPLECRILAIADAYEAMTGNRPYRNAISKERAVDEIRKYAGLQFDPLIADYFIESLEDSKNNLIILDPHIINLRQ
ncbi:MAG TPA: hypothetical protein DCW46_02690 [Desulfotomaculum sp.]|nr:hypothetical protein [Desulfotomaculum sp.]